MDAELGRKIGTGITVGGSVVVLIVAALGALALFATRMSRPHPAYATACGNNQRQIITAIIQYDNEHEAAPLGGVVPASCRGTAVGPRQARLITGRTFEVLAASLSLNNSLFRCRAPAAPPGPRLKPAQDERNGDAWSDQGPCYALDWAAPADASPGRALIADRGDWHDGRVLVGFADGHVERVALTGNPPKGLVTERVDGAAGALSTAAAAGADNWFDDDGDGGEATRPGAASPTRAWLK